MIKEEGNDYLEIEIICEAPVQAGLPTNGHHCENIDTTGRGERFRTRYAANAYLEALRGRRCSVVARTDSDGSALRGMASNLDGPLGGSLKTTKAFI